MRENVASISIAVLAVGIRLIAFESREHSRGDIELDGDLIVRQRLRDLVDLALERLVVHRIERLMQIVLQEQPYHRMCGNEVDLKPAAFGHDAARLEFGKFGVGLLRDIRIEQVAERNVANRLPRPQPIAQARRAAGMHAEKLIRLLERGIVGKYRFEPGNPVGTLAGFPIGDAFKVATQGRAHGLEHLARIAKRHASDKMNVTRAS